jgi:hypothetical protein
MFVEDIDLEAELSLGLLTNGTSAPDETYLKKFAIFIHQEYESKMRFPPEWLCDDNVASWH